MINRVEVEEAQKPLQSDLQWPGCWFVSRGRKHNAIGIAQTPMARGIAIVAAVKITPAVNVNGNPASVVTKAAAPNPPMSGRVDLATLATMLSGQQLTLSQIQSMSRTPRMPETPKMAPPRGLMDVKIPAAKAVAPAVKAVSESMNVALCAAGICGG